MGLGIRSHGQWIAIRSVRVRFAGPHTLEAAHVDRSPSRTDRHPHRSWRDLRVTGTLARDLAHHVFVAGPAEDVEAPGARRRCRWAVGALGRAPGEGTRPDGPALPVDRDPGGRAGRLLEPPRAAKRIDREPCRRSGIDCDLASPAAGEDRQDRWRSLDPYSSRLQARRAAGLCDGQGSDARRQGCELGLTAVYDLVWG